MCASSWTGRAGPDRAPGLQFVPFRSLLPENDEFLPLSPGGNQASVQPILPGKSALLPPASSRSADLGFSIAHPSMYVMGGGIIAVRGVGLEGKEGALQFFGRASGAGVENISMGCGPRKLHVMNPWEISASPTWVGPGGGDGSCS